jgi:hypothetical protein
MVYAQSLDYEKPACWQIVVQFDPDEVCRMAFGHFNNRDQSLVSFAEAAEALQRSYVSRNQLRVPKRVSAHH